MRFNWFSEQKVVSYKNCSLTIPDYVELPDTEINSSHTIYNDRTPVFFGHYWMRGNPKIQSDNAVCVDYSVAKGGLLTAYQLNGKEKLSDDNFIY
jgi:hypothetical protein